MAPPVLFVTGLGRCGTTMVMAMLRAAGTPVAGTPPDFEDVPLRPSGVDADWVWRQRGRAVKWIDPSVTRLLLPHPADGCAILLTRDPAEQAASQLKLLTSRKNRTQRRAMAALVRRDTIRARRIVHGTFAPGSVLELRFEDILREPEYAARRMAVLCAAHGIAFGDPADAARVVIARPVGCAPDLAIEEAAMAREGR